MACNPFDLPNIDTFKIMYPSFATIADATLTLWLSKAKAELCHSQLCRHWETGVYLYMAHQLTVTGALGGSSGQVAGQGQTVQEHTDGDVTVVFDTTNSAVDPTMPYSGSPFGLQLSALIRRTGMRIFNTGMAAGCGCG